MSLVCIVQVTTSLDEARSAAHQREGNAIAKYNFKAQSPIELSLRVVSSMCVCIVHNSRFRISEFLEQAIILLFAIF